MGGYSMKPSKKRELDRKIAAMRKRAEEEELKRLEQKEDPVDVELEH